MMKSIIIYAVLVATLFIMNGASGKSVAKKDKRDISDIQRTLVIPEVLRDWGENLGEGIENTGEHVGNGWKDLVMGWNEIGQMKRLAEQRRQKRDISDKLSDWGESLGNAIERVGDWFDNLGRQKRKAE